MKGKREKERKREKSRRFVGTRLNFPTRRSGCVPWQDKRVVVIFKIILDRKVKPSPSFSTVAPPSLSLPPPLSRRRETGEFMVGELMASRERAPPRTEKNFVGTRFIGSVKSSATQIAAWIRTNHGFTINSPPISNLLSAPSPPLLLFSSLDVLHRGEFRLLVKLGLLETNKGDGQRSFSPPFSSVEHTYTNAHGQTWSAPAFTFSKGASAFPRTGTGHAPLLFHAPSMYLLSKKILPSPPLPISGLTGVNQNSEFSHPFSKRKKTVSRSVHLDDIFDGK